MGFANAVNGRFFDSGGSWERKKSPMAYKSCTSTAYLSSVLGLLVSIPQHLTFQARPKQVAHHEQLGPLLFVKGPRNTHQHSIFTLLACPKKKHKRKDVYLPAEKWYWNIGNGSSEGRSFVCQIPPEEAATYSKTASTRHGFGPLARPNRTLRFQPAWVDQP